MNAITPVLLAVGLALAGPTKAQHAADPLPFAIEGKHLPDALAQWSQVTGLQVISQAQVLRNMTASPVVGSYTAMEALRLLLANTQLTFTTVGEHTVAIEPIERNVTTRKVELPLQRLAAAQPVAASPARTLPESAAQADTTERPEREEVIVTAQKRSEALQDVPVPVTAISADLLVSSNLLRVQDYYVRVPGLNMAPGDFHGAPQLAVRGVTTGGFSSPTVGVVIDDVPYGSSLGVTLGNEAPDFDPSELQRVELLRGPQGTLYGASSMGGLLKFVTVDPSTEKFSGRVHVGTSSVRNGDELGYNVRGSANVPISDTWAVRASGFTRLDPGYVDNPVTGEEGINKSNVHGGRLSALWRPSEVFSVKLSAMFQNIDTDGSSEIYRLPGVGDLQQRALLGTGVYDKDIRVYSVTMNADLGRFDLTSITGYNISEFRDSIDYTRFRGAGALAQFGVSGAALQNHFETEKLTQEIRLTTPLGDRADLLFGVFYNDETTDPRQQNMMAVDPATGRAVGALFYDTTPNEFTEYAAFANLTLYVTDRFDVQFGGRLSHNEQSSHQIRTVTAGGSFAIPESSTEEDPFTYLVTPRFRITPDLMAYARLASGYRPGGPNPNALLLGLPTAFEPDKTYNYEVGVKGNVMNGVLSYDASVYYIDWKDMQLQLISSGGQGYFANTSGAKSQGVELSVEAEPLDGLSLSGWIAYNEAELTEPFPVGSTARGVPGDRLPISSRVSSSLSVQQEFPVFANATAFVGATVSYVGDRKGVFTPGSTVRQEFPAYTKTDLSTGLRYEDWTAALFVNNLTDRRGMLSGGVGTIHPTAFSYIQPRTAGLSVTKAF